MDEIIDTTFTDTLKIRGDTVTLMFKAAHAEMARITGTMADAIKNIEGLDMSIGLGKESSTMHSEMINAIRAGMPQLKEKTDAEILTMFGQARKNEKD